MVGGAVGGAVVDDAVGGAVIDDAVGGAVGGAFVGTVNGVISGMKLSDVNCCVSVT